MRRYSFFAFMEGFTIMGDTKKDKGIVIELHPEIAKLNEVRGFNPAELLIPLQDEPGFTIPVSGKLTWFRLVYPKGKIHIRIADTTADRSVVEAYLYADRSDAENEYLAVNAGSCERNMENKFIQGRHLEVAASRAIARVLETAGFGCQYSSFNGLADEGGSPSSTPAAAGSGASKSSGKTTIKQLEEKQDGEKEKAGEAEPSGSDVPAPDDGVGSDAQPTTVEEWKNVLSYEDAKAVVTVHTNGANKGKTLGELCLSDARAVAFVANKYGGKNLKAKAAAQILLEAGAEAVKTDESGDESAA